MDCQTVRRPQYIAAVIVNILAFVYGLAIGWAAPMQPLLQLTGDGNDTSPLGNDVRALSDEEYSWVSSSLSAAGTAGTPLMGFLTKTLGRKKTLLISVLLFIMSFSLTACATALDHIIVSRILAGLGAAGSCVVTPMYTGETVQDQIRGFLASFLNLFIGFGIVIAYVVGSFTDYMTLTLFCLAWALIFLVFILFVPESPVYLLQVKRDKEAFQSLLKLRGNRKDIAEKEIVVLSGRVKEMMSNAAGSMSFKQMMRDQPTRKGLFIVLTVLSLQQLCGISAVLNYTVAIFNASGTDLSSSLCTIIIGLLAFVGALVGTLLVDHAGRRMLLLVSSIGMTITLLPICCFYYLKSGGVDESFLESIGWLPVTSLSLYVIVYSIGFGPVPFVLISESFKTSANALASSIAITHVWFFVFLMVKFFSNISNALGIEVCFMIFNASCAFGIFFVYYFVVETKGRSMEEIIQKLSKTTMPSQNPSVTLSDKSEVVTEIVLSEKH